VHRKLAECLVVHNGVILWIGGLYCTILLMTDRDHGRKEWQNVYTRFLGIGVQAALAMEIDD